MSLFNRLYQCICSNSVAEKQVWDNGDDGSSARDYTTDTNDTYRVQFWQRRPKVIQTVKNGRAAGEMYPDSTCIPWSRSK